MPEQFKPQPLTHDQLASQDDFTVELRKEHGARYNQMGQFVLENAQVDALYEQHLGAPNVAALPLAERQMAKHQTHTTPESEEAAPMTVEQAKEMVQHTWYGMGYRGVGGYESAFNTATKKRLSPRVLGQLFGQFDIPSPLGNDAELEEEQEFNKLGVSEVMTMVPINEFATEQGWPSAGKYQGNMFLLQYKTVVKSGARGVYPYSPAGDARGQQYFSYNICLAEKQAKTLWATLERHPQLARELGDMMMTSPNSQPLFGVAPGVMPEEEWRERYRPPYEEWREINGGVDRLAFRTSCKQTPSQSKIVEY